MRPLLRMGQEDDLGGTPTYHEGLAYPLRSKSHAGPSHLAWLGKSFCLPSLPFLVAFTTNP